MALVALFVRLLLYVQPGSSSGEFAATYGVGVIRSLRWLEVCWDSDAHDPIVGKSQNPRVLDVWHGN
jgi:hypothetical protein